MLVLSRKVGDTIRIGNNIVITVTRLNRDKVRLGIVAPSDVHIIRGELAPEDAQATTEVEIVSSSVSRNETANESASVTG